MKFRLAALFLFVLLTARSFSAPALIPLPVEMTIRPGTFEWRPGTAVSAPPSAAASVALLRNYLGPLVGRTARDAPVIFEQKNSLAPEAYELEIAPRRVIFRAGTVAGWDQAIQTLRELMPPERLGVQSDADFTLPCLLIKDAPRFRWRGLMLDCSRHFFSKEFIEKFIDLMALHKLNVFHWHLTDDQGWRLEIKKYPRLTEIGAWRGTGDQRYGGFYTQDDAREIVRYAAERSITVVPEIEMPGHMTAALVAYPEFSCGGGPAQVPTKFGAMPSYLDVGKEETYAFIDNVLAEVAQIFPSSLIHVGGDEVDKSRWHVDADCQALMKANGLKNEDELQSYFVRRAQKILAAKGKRLLGWEEIQEGGLAPGATVMSWRGDGSGGLAATESNDDMVMSPQTPLYFDWSYADNSVARVYAYNPIAPGLDAGAAAHIIGAQANIWTESIPTPEDVEKKTYPRACALAEVVWSAPAKRNYRDFCDRLKVHLARLDALGVKYHDLTFDFGDYSVIGAWKSGGVTEISTPHEWDVTGKMTFGKSRIRFQYTGGADRLEISGVKLLADDIVVAGDDHAGATGAADQGNVFVFQVPPLRAGGKLILRANVRGDGGVDSNGEIQLETPEPR